MYKLIINQSCVSGPAHQTLKMFLPYLESSVLPEVDIIMSMSKPVLLLIMSDCVISLDIVNAVICININLQQISITTKRNR